MAQTVRMFLAGAGRSGTTFVAKLLDSSSEVEFLHEPDSVDVNTDIPFIPDPDTYPQHAPAASAYLDRLYAQRSAKAMGTRPFFPKTFRNPVQAAIHKSSVYAAKGLERIGIDAPPLSAKSNSRGYQLIKSVDSLCRLPLFSVAGPDIRFLHLVRNPLAVAASVSRGIESGNMRQQIFYQTMFRSAEVARYPFSREELTGKGWVEQVTYQWMLQNNKVFAEMNGQANYLLVSYEQVCREPQRELERMAQFCGLPMDQQMREFVKQLLNASSDGGYFNVIRNPAASLGRWKKDLDEKHVDDVLAILEHSELGQALEWREL